MVAFRENRSLYRKRECLISLVLEMGPSTLPNGRGHFRALNDPLNLNALTLTFYLMLGLRVVSV